MIERLAIVIVLATLVVVVSLVVRSVARRRAAAAAGQALPEELRERFPTGEPGIVYFYGPHCAFCRQQAAILDRLSVEDGVAVIRVDGTRNTGLADAFGIMTVPSTVVVDGGGTVRSVTFGLCSRNALLLQLGEPVDRPANRTASG